MDINFDEPFLATVTPWEHQRVVLSFSSPGVIEIPEHLGRDGWELVAVLPHSSNSQQFYFKRPRPTTAR